MDFVTLAVRQRDAHIEVELLDAERRPLAKASSDDPVSKGELDGIRDLIAHTRDTTSAIPESGRKLGRWLLPEKVRAVWLQYAQKGRLRTILEIDPLLADLPWEMACSEERLFLNAQLPFLRHANAGLLPWSVTNWPLDVLVVLGSKPEDLETIGGYRELTAIREVLRPRNRAVHLHVLHQPDRERIKSALGHQLGDGAPRTSIRPHILHFIGHGSEGGLELATPAGYATWTGQAIRTDLSEAGFSPPLVYLNACRSTGRDQNDETTFEPLRASQFAPLAQAFFDKGARAVVAMHADIDGNLAGKCAQAFYKSLSVGESVDIAAASARAAVDRTQPNEAGISEKRDAYLPVLLVSGAPETVLPAITDLAEPPPNAQIDEDSNLQRIVRELVDHDECRRTALRSVLGNKSSHNVLVVHGAAETGKSWLLGWCIDGWLRRKIRVCYVPMFAHKDWLEVVRAILTGKESLGAVSNPLPKAREFFEAVVCPKRAKSGNRTWPKATKLDPEETLATFHSALCHEAGSSELLLVLDQFGSPATNLNTVVFQILWEKWIETYVMGGDHPVRVVLGLSTSDVERFQVAISAVPRVELKPITSEHFHSLLEELLMARHRDDYERLRSRLDKVLKDITAPAPELTPKTLSDKCKAIFEVANMLKDAR